MEYDVRLEQLDSRPIAVVRRRASSRELARVVPDACGLVWNVMSAQQVKAGRHVALYSDCADGELTAEVGAEVNGPFTEQDGVIRSATPAGEVATVTHFGPYSGLAAANRALAEWRKANNRRFAGPSWEVYGHWQKEWDTDPSRIRTDVYYLLG